MPEHCAATLTPDTECTVALSTGFSTKLSSAGLVYKHFGRDIVAAQLGQPAESPDVETVYLAVYKHFMEAIDGIDNGGNTSSADSFSSHCSCSRRPWVSADDAGNVSQ